MESNPIGDSPEKFKSFVSTIEPDPVLIERRFQGVPDAANCASIDWTLVSRSGFAALPLFKIALVLVRLDHVATIIVNAYHDRMGTAVVQRVSDCIAD